MEITSVKITLVPQDERLKAYASITFDNCFVVHDLKIIRTGDKVFVAMPSKRYKNEYRDVAHPLDKQTRKDIHDFVLSEYKNQIKKLQSEGDSLSVTEHQNNGSSSSSFESS